MSWKKNHSKTPRCLYCRMHLNLCLCAVMPHFDLKTRIILIMQAGEYGVTSNTGHLIPKILSNSDLRFRGLPDRTPVDLSNLVPPNTEPYILFPAGNAHVLSSDFVQRQTKPMSLIVLDGNWRQAQKMIKRIPLFHNIPKVILPEGEPSSYRLRASKIKEGVCTFEAIARALGIIEGADIQKQMEAYFTVMVERILWTRNKIRAFEVTGGIPV